MATETGTGFAANPGVHLSFQDGQASQGGRILEGRAPFLSQGHPVVPVSPQGEGVRIYANRRQRLRIQRVDSRSAPVFVKIERHLNRCGRQVVHRQDRLLAVAAQVGQHGSIGRLLEMYLASPQGSDVIQSR